MRVFAPMILGLAMLAGCASDAENPSPAEGPDPVVLTRWSEATELFVEHPPLVAGRPERFAVHLTRLSDFRPVERGRVVVSLKGADGSIESFEATAPSKPGIFGVDVTPRSAGSFSLAIELDAPGLVDRHEVGPVEVAADALPAPPGAGGEEAGEIRFLKEQQWALDFATEVVAARPVRESVRVPGTVEPRAGGDAFVTAPTAGRLGAAGSLPAAGSEVRAGQVLAVVIPRGGDGLSRGALEAEVRAAEIDLELSLKDRERARRLVAAGAAPSKRLDEAEARAAAARARLDAAGAGLARHETIRLADNEPPADTAYRLRAPFTGVVTEARATVGAVVEEGTHLFRVVALDRVHVVAHVPEAEAARLPRPAAAEADLNDGGPVIRLDRLVGILPVVDPVARTRRVIYEASNEDRRLTVGASVLIRLLGEPGDSGPAVRESAIVDDAGRPVLFVQAGGESFHRRPVTLGAREAGYVRVTEGVAEGERVVTKGAYLIRLSSLSGQIPAHGHVH